MKFNANEIETLFEILLIFTFIRCEKALFLLKLIENYFTNNIKQSKNNTNKYAKQK